MGTSDPPRTPFGSWLAQPQSLIALSALLLSVCGLFVAVYETSLIRRAQRASVWPSVQVSASIRDGTVSIWARNAGVGPARIESAAVMHDGVLQESWSHLVRSVLGEAAGEVQKTQSFLNGSVLAADSELEYALTLTARDEATPSPALASLARAMVDGSVDVVVCYCSVYDECWTSRLRGVVDLSGRDASPPAAVSVPNCKGAPRSRI